MREMLALRYSVELYLWISWLGIQLRAGFGHRLLLDVLEDGWRPFRPNVLVISMLEGRGGVLWDALTPATGLLDGGIGTWSS